MAVFLRPLAVFPVPIGRVEQRVVGRYRRHRPPLTPCHTTVAMRGVGCSARRGAQGTGSRPPLRCTATGRCLSRSHPRRCAASRTDGIAAFEVFSRGHVRPRVLTADGRASLQPGRSEGFSRYCWYDVYDT